MSLVVMPRLSDSMHEGTIVRWLVTDGDEVERGQEIAEIETDKATMAYEAGGPGVLRVLAPEGATVAVGAPIAEIHRDGEEPQAPVDVPREVGAPWSADPDTMLDAPPPGADASKRGSVNASPIARRVAQHLGIDLAGIQGSGKLNRILKADVVRASHALSAPGGPPVEVPAGATSAKGATEISAPSRSQQVVARRMSESRATIPDFVIEVDVDMTAVSDLRRDMSGVRDQVPSFNDFIVKAAASALRLHPRLNGSYRDGRFEFYERANVGVAVSAGDGLVVPTVFDADRRTLTDIAAEIRRLAGRVRAGTVLPGELAGGTFTVSNLGMFGVDRFAGVINPPQAAILCAGAVSRRPACMADGSLQPRELMSLSLVCDHRLVYGADAARYLSDVAALLEHPLRLLA